MVVLVHVCVCPREGYVMWFNVWSVITVNISAELVSVFDL